jgi:peptidoglycan-associated lipoprotein
MKSSLKKNVWILLALVLGACSSGVKLDEPAAPPVEDRAASAGPGQDARAVPKVDATVDPLSDPNNPLAKRSIYFDYDSYIVKDEFRPTVDVHAKYLLGNKNKKVVVQGNADERGGSEYNLALGQKRAEAVRKQLQLLGVSEGQLEAVSFGKEKPRALGHDEASWAENRRADLAYQ